MCKWRIPGGFSLFLYLAMLTLLPLRAQRASAADNLYVLTASTLVSDGTAGTYTEGNVTDSYKFTYSSGTTYTYTVNNLPTGGFYFRLYDASWTGTKEMQPYANGDNLVIDGSSYTISSDCYGSSHAWKVSYTDGVYESLTITVDLSTSSRSVKITGTKRSSSTGSTTTATNTAGIYLYGKNYGTSDPSKKMTYKFLRKNDSEYHFALYAGEMPFNVETYNSNNSKSDITPSCNGFTFNIAYVDKEGNVSTFCPAGGYTLTGTDSGAETVKTLSSGSTNVWTVQNNGGMYDLVVKVDGDGKPTAWYYESDANRIVAYKASSTSNWTTEGFLYCVKTSSTTSTAFCKNFFGTIPMVKDETFKFILGNYWFGQNYGEKTYGQNVATTGDAGDSPNLTNPYDGIYPVEFNPDRTDYKLGGNDETPLRIFMIGSALNSSLGDSFASWDPADATELVYDKEEGCYKGTVKLTKDKQFRFLRDKNATGDATSLELNFGEDSNAPSTAGPDYDDNNYVAYNEASTSGTNVTFNPETNVYNVRFYIEAGADMTGFSWTSSAVKYRYTIELPARLSITLDPSSATIPYGTTLTPKAMVIVPATETSTVRRYAYTLDGTMPTIDTTTGKGTGTTKVVEYTYDAIIPSNDVTTFRMDSKNVVNYILHDGTKGSLDTTAVTVTVQAIQKVSDTAYRLEGNTAKGTYTFRTAGVVDPEQNSYTIAVTNHDGTATSVNKVTASVVVTKNGTVDTTTPAYYTIDGTNPATSKTRRLVRNRQITIYTLPQGVAATNTIKVCVAGAGESESSADHASCPYDLTYSTSEGGYENYLNNDPSTKTLGGEGDVVIYVLPYSSDATNFPLSGYDTYVSAYEVVMKNDTTVANRLTPSPGHIFTAADTVTVNNETWYAFDAQPSAGFSEVNVSLGRRSASGTEQTTPVVVANANKDMFLKYDIATGEITEVTRAYTGDYFYTVGTEGATGVTKFEAANPNPLSSTTNKQHFIYVQVPDAWVTDGNSLKVLNGSSVVAEGDNVEVQPAAETSSNSLVCKVYGLNALTEGTTLTFQPYGDTTAGQISFSAPYQDGGYYYYESAMQYSSVPYLIFSPNTTTDQDLRSYGHHDINHVTTGDQTNFLTKNWNYSTAAATETTTVSDNWTGTEATVNIIPAGATISQTINGLEKSTSYTVQMIVRGQDGAKGTLLLEGADNGKDSTTFKGYDAASSVTTDGRVDALLLGTTNGWRKLETKATTSETGALTISLSADSGELQLSDVTLLERANEPGYVQTRATTDNQTTEVDLSNRAEANAFSFFDRGSNKNAVVYVDANTVEGRSENTINVAVASTVNGTTTYTVKNFRITDQAQDGTTDPDGKGENCFYCSAWTLNTSHALTANTFGFERHYTKGQRSTICLPVSLTADEIYTLFGSDTKVYQLDAIDLSKKVITAHDNTADGITANQPYIIETGADYNDGTISGTFSVPATNSVSLTQSIGSGYSFIGTYALIKIYFDDRERCYNFGAREGGRFDYIQPGGARMKPFRAYVKAPDPSSSSAKAIQLSFDNVATTAIEDVEEMTIVNDAPIFSLSGTKVADAKDCRSLKAGVYIQNGKKIIIK